MNISVVIPLYNEEEKCIFDVIDSSEKMNVDQLFKHSSYGLYKVTWKEQ